MYRKKIIALFLLTTILSCNDSDNAELEKPDLTPPLLVHTPVNMSKVLQAAGFGDGGICFTYRLATQDEPVMASCAGYIVNVFQNPNYPHRDYEIHIKTSQNSAWLMVYDHVQNVKVKIGDYVESGEVLGTVGDMQNMFELQINNEVDHYVYCPFHIASQSFIDEHDSLWSIIGSLHPSKPTDTIAHYAPLPGMWCLEEKFYNP